MRWCGVSGPQSAQHLDGLLECLEIVSPTRLAETWRNAGGLETIEFRDVQRRSAG
ncbi:MAG: hypothetical protein IPL58_16285 [Betaproteobacteria bacterium]|uniref:Uncharacterized protein n=1 Tax=Candidatus Proximibacter danicus TaxID=2954365 RepID=A0A9D7K4P7_9PROT|nr:hypothetical protein [Candidatus Proximibacter danicus]